MLISAAVPLGITVKAEEAQSLAAEINYDFAVEVLERINDIRKANGCSKLVMTKPLCIGAETRAGEIVFEQSHTRPNGEPFYTAYEWHVVTGENLAIGQSTPEQVVSAWMASPGHKANILYGDYKTIGIACLIYEGCYYWVQDFNGVKGESYKPTGTKAVTLNPNGEPSETNGDAVKPTSIKKLKKGKKYLKIFWEKVDTADGYEIQYSLSKKFPKGKKTQKKKIKKANVVAFTAKKLKSKKTYYVRVRTYKKVDGKLKYSKWSKVKKSKVK